MDIAQATHECILRTEGVLDPNESLVFGEPLPASKRLQGVYIDDYLRLERVELMTRAFGMN